MRTKTIGEILSQQRLKHQVSLAQMSRKTRIRLKYLKALEENQFEKLPASTFVKGYIKTYGRLFGFDYQPLISLLRRDYKESAKGQLIPLEFIKPLFKKRQFWRPATILVLSLTSFFLILMIYVGFQWFELNRPPKLTLIAPLEDQVVAARVEVSGQTKLDSIITVNSQPVALQTDGSFQTELFLSREGVNTITIEAKDRRGHSTLVQRTVRVKF